MASRPNLHRNYNFATSAPIGVAEGATGDRPKFTPAGRATLIHDRNDAITLAMSSFLCVLVAGLDIALWWSL